MMLMDRELLEEWRRGLDDLRRVMQARLEGTELSGGERARIVAQIAQLSAKRDAPMDLSIRACGKAAKKG